MSPSASRSASPSLTAAATTALGLEDDDEDGFSVLTWKIPPNNTSATGNTTIVGSENSASDTSGEGDPIDPAAAPDAAGAAAVASAISAAQTAWAAEKKRMAGLQGGVRAGSGVLRRGAADPGENNGSGFGRQTGGRVTKNKATHTPMHFE